ncbi:hypothetical protein FJZ17_00515 [Candidatus Pacearchaeota archaeon]|nr:hypothetical protein [Candidatus Pacearchaeota archaeon]
MAERDNILGAKVKHNGVFDFKETYRILYEWLVSQGYDMNEKTYKEVIGAGGAKELEIEWEAIRKVSDYFRFLLKVDWKIIGMTSVEVEIDGVKQKMNKGQFEIGVKAILIKDYENRWENRPIWKFLRGLYDKYVIKERQDQYEGKLIGEMDEFLAQCKAYLALTGRR